MVGRARGSLSQPGKFAATQVSVGSPLSADNRSCLQRQKQKNNVAKRQILLTEPDAVYRLCNPVKSIIFFNLKKKI